MTAQGISDHNNGNSEGLCIYRIGLGDFRPNFFGIWGLGSMGNHGDIRLTLGHKPDRGNRAVWGLASKYLHEQRRTSAWQIHQKCRFGH